MGGTEKDHDTGKSGKPERLGQAAQPHFLDGSQAQGGYRDTSALLCLIFEKKKITEHMVAVCASLGGRADLENWKVAGGN